MIPYEKMRKDIAKGLSEHLGIKVIRANQTAEAPAYPYGTYNATTIAQENKGTWQKHADGIDRQLVRSVWSFSFLSKDHDESVALAIRAREWFDHVGRAWLSERGITVQSTTDINNRDNILTVEYERKNGFDAFFYVYNEVENPLEATGYIQSAEITRTTMT